MAHPTGGSKATITWPSQTDSGCWFNAFISPASQAPWFLLLCHGSGCVRCLHTAECTDPTVGVFFRFLLSSLLPPVGWRWRGRDAEDSGAGKCKRHTRPAL